ncbi:MAG: RluA family pseudouridine synthase, partial [Candidatus Omnitrophica bacterium]|nr:RluA family pseudouridine synthase [Candidatus Omnitrophota bacterium]
MSVHSLTVTEDDADVRVDSFITRALSSDIPSRMFVKRLVEAGRVQVNGAVVKANHKLRTGDVVLVDILLEDYPDERIKPEAVALDIVYEDEEMLAINKPVGMAVHPAAGNYGGTLANALVHHFGELSDVNGSRRPGIVHRLDKETSGVILVAKTNMAHARLASQFEKHTIEKKYVALVEGVIQSHTFFIGILRINNKLT